ncbi:hypothetical protein L7F22_004350 [Adiantum nelumboides]|nr:hypothetical protein [Adiantum nelumboides]
MQEWLRQARQIVTDKLQRFEGRDISKFCRVYEQAMEDNGIQDQEAVDGFHLIVVPELRARIAEIQAHQGAEWQDFKKALKEEYFLEDSQRVRVDKLIVGADSTKSSDEEAKDKSATLKHKLEEPVLDDLVKGIQELNLNLKAVKLEGLSSKGSTSDYRPRPSRRVCMWCDSQDHEH